MNVKSSSVLILIEDEVNTASNLELRLVTRRRPFILLTLLLVGLVRISNATTYYWQPTTGSANWNIAGNWNTIPGGGGATGVPGAADIAVFFQGNSTCVMPLAVPTTVRGLKLTGFGAGSINLNAGTLTVIPTTVADIDLSAGAIKNSSVLNATIIIDGSLLPLGSAAISVTGMITAAILPGGAPAMILTVPNVGTGVSVSSNTFNGSFTVNAPDNISISGNTFKNPVLVNCTGASPASYTLGNIGSANTFVGAAAVITVRNSGTGDFIYKSDIIGAPITFDNTAAGSLTVGPVTANNTVVANNSTTGLLTVTGSTFNGTCTMNIPANLTVTGNSFIGSLVINKTGTANFNLGSLQPSNTFPTAPKTVTIQNSGTAGTFTYSVEAFNTPLIASNTSTGALVIDKISVTAGLNISSTSTGSTVIDRTTADCSPDVAQNSDGQISLGTSSGYFQLNAGYTLTGPGFTNGRLYTYNFTQLGSTAQNITFANGGATTPIVYLGAGTVFNGDITNFTAPKIVFNGATFNGATNNFTQNNTLNTSPYRNDVSVGSNVFNGTTSITNSGFGTILLDGNNTFSNLSVINTSNSAGAAMTLGYDFASSGTLTDIYNGNVSIQSTGSAPMNIAYNVASQMNGNITVSCTGSCSGITFGGSNGTATLANGKTIAAGGAGFTTSQLTLNGFTQVGTTAQTINLTGTAVLAASQNSATTPVPTTFNAAVNFTAPAFSIGSVVFNGTASLTKTGNGADSWPGGSTFNADATLVDSGTGCMACPSPSADTFNANLSITKASAVAALFNFKLAGNLTLSSPDAVGFILGNIEFIGAAPQTITKSSSDPFLQVDFSSVTLNKTTASIVTLVTPLNLDVSGTATFTKGIIRAYQVNLNGSVVGGSNVSFLNGYVGRVAGAAPFTFPVGDINGMAYRPVTIGPNAYGFTVSYGKSKPPFSTAVKSPITNVSQCEYWGVSYTGSPPAITVTLSWVSAECTVPESNYITSLGNLRVAYLNTSNKWEDQGNTATTGTASTGTVTSSLNSYSAPGVWAGAFTLGSFNSGLNPLPIELSKFSVKLVFEDVRLEWQTASELNNDHFEIERSPNGIDFSKIVEVDGHGTTSIEHKYSFLDSDPLSGLSYYRLRQVDFDGESTYSEIVSVSNFESDRSVISFFPNPASDKLFASHKTDITIVDVLGNVVYSAKEVNEISLARLNPGVYCLMAASGEVFRFVKN